MGNAVFHCLPVLNVHVQMQNAYIYEYCWPIVLSPTKNKPQQAALWLYTPAAQSQTLNTPDTHHLHRCNLCAVWNHPGMCSHLMLQTSTHLAHKCWNAIICDLLTYLHTHTMCKSMSLSLLLDNECAQPRSHPQARSTYTRVNEPHVTNNWQIMPSVNASIILCERKHTSNQPDK